MVCVRGPFRGDGSSPLTRGKLSTAATSLWRLRLIPAHAGKTLEGLAGLLSGLAHPRSRGENRPRARSGPVRHGSSPLTRGKQPRSSRAKTCNGLIPAHAGKTRSVHGGVDPEEAHPRSRGENIRSIHERRGNLGSSPLTRGKLPGMLHLIAIVRLIPAHAGKTVGHCACKHHGPAHPRSRGENATGIVTNGQGDGSSPLTRGKLM